MLPPWRLLFLSRRSRSGIVDVLLRSDHLSSDLRPDRHGESKTATWMSRCGCSLPANASGFDPHRASISSRFQQDLSGRVSLDELEHFFLFFSQNEIVDDDEDSEEAGDAYSRQQAEDDDDDLQGKLLEVIAVFCGKDVHGWLMA
eukprot:COSAG01_NODE_533_length_15816_cov_4.518738_7_plen_145_part_00